MFHKIICGCVCAVKFRGTSCKAPFLLAHCAHIHTHQILFCYSRFYCVGFWYHLFRHFSILPSCIYWNMLFKTADRNIKIFKRTAMKTDSKIWKNNHDGYSGLWKHTLYNEIMKEQLLLFTQLIYFCRLRAENIQKKSPKILKYCWGK